MINTAYIGSLQPPLTQTLSSTTTTDIGSAAEEAKILAAFSIINPTGAAVDTSVYWRDVGGTDHRIWHESVASKTTRTIDSAPVMMGKGQKIRVKGDNLVEVVLYYSQGIKSL